MSHSLRVALGWIAVIALFVIAVFIFRSNLQRAALRSAPIGARAHDVRLTGLDAKPTSLSAYLGHPLWVNFFATWCGPCKAELPEIEARYASYRDRGLVVLGVDEQEDASLVKPFVRRMKLTFPVAIDASGAATLTYHVGAIPTSVFIGADGNVKAVHVGEMSPQNMDEDLKKIL